MRTVGDGTRALNFFLDTLIIFIITYFSYKGYNFYVMYWGYHPYNFGWFFFGILFIYYFLFETIFARTPAKWFTYSKVTDKQGRRPGPFRVALRCLTRLTIIDLFFMPFLSKPLHDYLSGTEVIEI